MKPGEILFCAIVFGFAGLLAAACVGAAVLNLFCKKENLHGHD